MPIQPGEHRGVDFVGCETYVSDGDALRRVSIHADIHVSIHVYYTALPLIEVTGFQDAQTGMIATKSFTTSGISMDKILAGWTKIESEDELVDCNNHL